MVPAGEVDDIEAAVEDSLHHLRALTQVRMAVPPARPAPPAPLLCSMLRSSALEHDSRPHSTRPSTSD
jgi:hypothetical protein